MSMLRVNPAVPARSLEENLPFLPDERMIAFLTTKGLCRPVAQLIAEYVTQRLNDFIFGPEHWKYYWDAIPVTLPHVEVLQRRIANSGKEPPKPVEQMSAEECANFLGELGEEDHPQLPKKLCELLDKPVRPNAPGEKPAGFTCAVTYIPEFVRKDGRVMAVTFKTLTSELGPKPVRGNPAYLNKAPRFTPNLILTQEHLDRTEPACFFVMELDLAPGTKGLSTFQALQRIKRQGDRKWDAPEARNFVATVFARRVWKGEYFGGKERVFAYGKGRSLYKDYVYMAFSLDGLYLFHNYGWGNAKVGAIGSKKIKPPPSKGQGR